MNPKDIKQIRLSLKMTQASFGAVLGLTGNTIARYERGESQPDNPTMFALAVEQVRQQKIAEAYAPEWQALLERSKQMADELKAGVAPEQQRVRKLFDVKKLDTIVRRSIKQLQKSKAELEGLVNQQLAADKEPHP